MSSSQPRGRRRPAEADDAQSATAEARRRYESPGFVGAFVDGWRARRAGRTLDACPYRAGRRRSPSTWARTWRSAWIAGWLFADVRQSR